MQPMQQHQERDTPQNWEVIADRVPLRYSRHGELEHANEVAFAALAEERAETLARVSRLDALRVSLGRASGTWVELLKPLAVSMWNQARVLAGMRELRVSPGLEHPTPFSCVRAALAFAVASADRVLGLGPIDLTVAEDRDEDLRERRRMAAHGAPVPAGARRGPRARRGPPLLAPAASGGYRSAECIPCKPSRSGSTGGTKGQPAIELALDVWGAVRAARLSAVDQALLLAAEVGQLEHVAGTPKGAREMVRRTAAQLAADFNREVVELDPITVQAMGRRIGRVRRAVAERLEERGLVPGMRAKSGRPRRQAIDDVLTPFAPEWT